MKTVVGSIAESRVPLLNGRGGSREKGQHPSALPTAIKGMQFIVA